MVTSIPRRIQIEPSRHLHPRFGPHVSYERVQTDPGMHDIHEFRRARGIVSDLMDSQGTGTARLACSSVNTGELVRELAASQGGIISRAGLELCAQTFAAQLFVLGIRTASSRSSRI